MYFFYQVLDVERMVAKNTMPQAQDQGTGTNLENHPVIRTLYDHMEVIPQSCSNRLILVR